MYIRENNPFSWVVAECNADNYKHNYLNLAVNIYFAAVVITSLIKQQDKNKTSVTISPPQPHAHRSVCACSPMDTVPCTLITCTELVLCAQV